MDEEDEPTPTNAVFANASVALRDAFADSGGVMVTLAHAIPMPPSASTTLAARSTRVGIVGRVTPVESVLV